MPQRWIASVQIMRQSHRSWILPRLLNRPQLEELIYPNNNIFVKIRFLLLRCGF